MYIIYTVEILFLGKYEEKKLSVSNMKHIKLDCYEDMEQKLENVLVLILALVVRMSDSCNSALGHSLRNKMLRTDFCQILFSFWY